MIKFCEWLFETKVIIYKFLVRWDGENGEYNTSLPLSKHHVNLRGVSTKLN